MDQIKQAQILNEIVEKWARESGKIIDVVINEVARALDIDEKIILKRLKLINSPFVDPQNKVVGYLEGKPMKRTTYHMIVKRIYENVAGVLVKKGVYSPSDASHQLFLAEAMYQHAKNNF